MSQKANSFTTSVRCDARDVATILVLLQEQGRNPKSISEIFKTSIEILVELATRKGVITPFESTIEAVSYLEKHNLMPKLNEKAKRNLTNLLDSPDEDIPKVNNIPVQQFKHSPNKSVNAPLEKSREELIREHYQREEADRIKREALARIPSNIAVQDE